MDIARLPIHFDVQGRSRMVRLARPMVRGAPFSICRSEIFVFNMFVLGVWRIKHA